MAAMIFSRLRGAQVTALDTRRDRLDFCTRQLDMAASVQIAEDDEQQLAAAAQARQQQVRLVLLWFGTWKNTSAQYTPEWVKLDLLEKAKATLKVN